MAVKKLVVRVLVCAYDIFIKVHDLCKTMSLEEIYVAEQLVDEDERVRMNSTWLPISGSEDPECHSCVTNPWNP